MRVRFVDHIMFTDDAEFEAKHKRDEDGKFASQEGKTNQNVNKTKEQIREERYENSVKEFCENRGLPYVSPRERIAVHESVHMPDISEDQSYSIYRYTDDLFLDMNNHLRNGTPIDDEIQEHLSNIDEVMRNSTLDKPITVYRGVDNVDGLFKGRVFSDAGYCSTSADPYQAQDFGKNILILNLPKGLHAISTMAHSEYDNESEILLDRGVTGKIRRLENKGEYNLYYIDVELQNER